MEPEELEALTDEELDGRCRPAALEHAFNPNIWEAEEREAL